jgi:molecular chaperone Hsp33
MANAVSGALVHALLFDGNVRLLAVIATNQAEAIRHQHGLGRNSAKLASEGIVATLLMSASTHQKEKILLEIAGAVPEFTFSGEATSTGRVRARVHPKDLEPVTSIVGRLVTIKWGEHEALHRAVAEVDHDSLEAAIHSYFVQADKASGMVRIGADLLETGEVSFAGGVVVEWIGGANPSEQGVSLEKFVELLQPLFTERISDVISQVAFGSLMGSDLEVLERREVSLGCTCSLSKVEKTLQSLGAEEVRSLIVDPGQADVTCHFCGTSYHVGPERLSELAAELK